MRILFTGGGTLGPVTPLLALAEEIATVDHSRPRNSAESNHCDPPLAEKQSQILWLGTRKGPERKVVESSGIKFVAIPSAKLRRYFDWRTFVAPLGLCAGFFAALYHLIKCKPDAVITAGGYVGVPVVVAAWMLRIPSLIIQLDLKPVLSNLIAAPFARRIAVAFAGTLRYFPKSKTIHTGAPVRTSIASIAKRSHEALRGRGLERFHLDPDLPTVLVLGGGTGALRLNELIAKAVPAITKKIQMIHLTGPGKLVREASPHYYPLEFLQEMELAYVVADIVVCRAGMGTLSEVAAVELPTIFVPLPKSSQIDNAHALEERGAAIVVDQNKTSSADLAERIISLISDQNKLAALREKIRNAFPQNAAARLVEEISKL